MGYADLIGTAITLIGSILTIGLFGGAMQSKVKALREDLEQLETDFKEARDRAPEKYVRMGHFDAIITPIQAQISEIQRDIKSILMIVSKNEQNTHRSRKISD